MQREGSHHHPASAWHRRLSQHRCRATALFPFSAGAPSPHREHLLPLVQRQVHQRSGRAGQRLSSVTPTGVGRHPSPACTAHTPCPAAACVEHCPCVCHCACTFLPATSQRIQSVAHHSALVGGWVGLCARSVLWHWGMQTTSSPVVRERCADAPLHTTSHGSNSRSTRP